MASCWSRLESVCITIGTKSTVPLRTEHLPLWDMISIFDKVSDVNDSYRLYM